MRGVIGAISYEKAMSVVVVIFISTTAFVLKMPEKIGPHATESCVVLYNGPGNSMDIATAIAIAPSGNFYVTGGSVGTGTGWDYATIAYDQFCTELWVARYAGPLTSADDANDIALDSSGNIYVTGYGSGSVPGSRDYVTVAYTPSGKELWIAKYNGPGNDFDVAYAMAVNSYDNVYVTGYSTGSGTGEDFATVAYDQYGNELWVARYNGPRNGKDHALDITTDLSGNIYVTGYSYDSNSSYDYTTIAYDQDGNEVWVARYNGPENEDDKAYAIAIGPSGEIYVTGYSRISGNIYSDYNTVAYDSSGNELWVARYHGPGTNADDVAYAIATDSYGNVFVTGESYGGGTISWDYATIAYDSDGNELWTARYNGPGNSGDTATSIATDSYGNVYVSGSSYGNGTHHDLATLAYDSSGNELWIERYNGPGDFFDQATDIAIDPLGNVYVTGSISTIDTSYDYVTIKYSQVPFNQPPVADAGPDYEVNEGDVVELNGTGSYDPDGAIVSYEWDFGDGTSINGTLVSGVRPYGYQFDDENPGHDPTNAYDDGFEDTSTYAYTMSDSTGSHREGITYLFNLPDSTITAALHLTQMTIAGQNSIRFYNYKTHFYDQIEDWIPESYPSLITKEYNITYPYIDAEGHVRVYIRSSTAVSHPASEYRLYDIYIIPGDSNYNDTLSVSHVYGDDGVYMVTLKVTDNDGLSDTDTCNVTVHNVAPSIIDVKAVVIEAYADITLRLAGEKWHDATMYLYENGTEIGSVTVVRSPGSPDDQSASIKDVYFEMTKEYSAKVVYTPNDDPVNGQPNGANPAWIILTFEDGSEKRIHHTFNVKHPETWEWNVELNQYLLEEITIEATAIDPGSDDLTFKWSFGASTTFYNNAPINTPDPYPSPDGIFPFEAKDVVEYVYTGSTVVSLSILDDDSGSALVTITLA